MHSGPQLIFEDHKMVLPFRRSFGAFIFAVAATIAAAQPELATAEDHGAILSQVQNACIFGHRFEPGPIAGGRDRQPTVREFQARTQALGESKLRDAYSCAELPVGS
jgi:hypothetical protein